MPTRNTRPLTPILRGKRADTFRHAGPGPVGPGPTSVRVEGGGYSSILLETDDRLLVESGVGHPTSALPMSTTITADDLFYIVDDPSGTPTSMKVTAADLQTYLLAVEVISVLVTDTGDHLTTDTSDHIRAII